MRTIYKTELLKIARSDNGYDSYADVHMPEDAKVLMVNGQRGELCVWYELDDQAPRFPRRFWIIGTGMAFPGYAAAVHVGSACVTDHLVLHVYTERHYG